MSGGDIYHNDSSIARRVVARLSDCSAITLYKRQQDHLELVEYTGDVTPEKCYMINDENSFVALTYQANNNDTENIFYSEEKQQIYLTKKIGELVISAHFKLSEAWSERRVKRQHVPILKKDSLNLDCPFQFRILQKLLWFVINAYAKQNHSHTRND
jgi:outer membrane phospholipase A